MYVIGCAWVVNSISEDMRRETVRVCVSDFWTVVLAFLTLAAKTCLLPDGVHLVLCGTSMCLGRSFLGLLRHTMD